MRLEQAENQELGKIAEYISKVNQIAEMRCAYVGTDMEENLDYLEEIYEQNPQALFSLQDGNKVVGAVVGDICDDNQTIEVIGPYLNEEIENRDEYAKKMIQLMKELKPGFRLMFFLDEANSFIGKCVLNSQGKNAGCNYNMCLKLPQKHDESKSNCMRACYSYQNSEWEQEKIKIQIEKLHNENFPTAYYNGETILKMVDEIHSLSYCMDGDKVVSYAFFNMEEDGYLDFIATNKDYRNQGYATSLLCNVMKQLETMNASVMELCVAKKDEEAISLYDKIGFEVMEKNQAYRLD